MNENKPGDEFQVTNNFLDEPHEAHQHAESPAADESNMPGKLAIIKP